MARLFAAVLAALIALAGVAHAQEDAFTVTGVPIDASAENAAVARERAIAEGAPRALRRMFERLTLEEAHDRLPTIASSTATSLAIGFSVENELRGATRYRGDLTVSFEPNGVRNLLRRYGVPFVESPAPPTLVAPVYIVGGQASLWNANPWLEGWDESRYFGGFAPVVLPSGFGSRVSLMSAQAIAEGDLDTLALLADSYGVDRVLLAVAEPRGRQLEVKLTLVRMTEEPDLNAIPEDLGDQSDTFRLPGQPVAPEPEEDPLLDEYGEIDPFADSDRGLKPEPSDLGTVTVVAGEAANPFELAADRVHERLVEDWKQRTIIRSNSRSELQVTVLYEGLGEWHRMRSSLGSSPFVTDARLDALSGDGALMTLTYRGVRDQLVGDLLRRGLQLRGDRRLGDIVYGTESRALERILREPADAPRMPAEGPGLRGDDSGSEAFAEPADAPAGAL